MLRFFSFFPKWCHTLSSTMSTPRLVVASNATPTKCQAPAWTGYRSRKIEEHLAGAIECKRGGELTQPADDVDGEGVIRVVELELQGAVVEVQQRVVHGPVAEILLREEA
jgi:hypothetical protein